MNKTKEKLKKRNLGVDIIPYRATVECGLNYHTRDASRYIIFLENKL